MKMLAPPNKTPRGAKNYDYQRRKFIAHHHVNHSNGRIELWLVEHCNQTEAVDMA